MKQYTLVRYGMGRNSTLGFLSRIEEDGTATQVCFTLEDERRRTKVPGETCIPTGTYELQLRTDGGMHVDYSRRFGDRHKGMLWLQNVENFEWVYIHILNYEDQTEGCVGVGMAPGVFPDGEFWIGRSKDAYWEVYEDMVPSLIAGEKVVLHITEIQPWA